MSSCNAGTLSKDSEKYVVNPFVPQLATSILKRMEQAGARVSHLRLSHRMHGGLEVFPSRQFYREAMTSSHTDLSPEVKHLRTFLQIYGSECKSSSTLLIHIANSLEEQTGTTFTNYRNACYVVQ